MCRSQWLVKTSNCFFCIQLLMGIELNNIFQWNISYSISVNERKFSQCSAIFCCLKVIILSSLPCYMSSVLYAEVSIQLSLFCFSRPRVIFQNQVFRRQEKMNTTFLCNRNKANKIGWIIQLIMVITQICPIYIYFWVYLNRYAEC